MFNVIPFRAARNLMNTSMDDMLSDPSSATSST